MIQSIKKEFFAFRNGIIADALRKAGMPYKTIFGLQIPQLAQIARSYKPSMEIADELWNDKDVRESRLLATYLFPIDNISKEKAIDLMRSTQTPEESDMLSFRLLKRLPYASELLDVAQSDTSIPTFAVESLKRHLS